MATTVTTLEIPSGPAERLKQVANLQNSTADQVMQKAIEQFVSRAEWQSSSGWTP